MGYQRLMGFSVKMPANQVSGLKKSWDIWGYGLTEVWYKGVSTVIIRLTSYVREVFNFNICIFF